MIGINGHGVGLLAGWAGDIADLDYWDLLLELKKVFAVNGAVGVEELVGDVGQDGGAARGDPAFGDEGEEAGEEFVDVDAGIEVGEFGQEVGGEVFRVTVRLLRGAGVAQTEMVRTESKVGL